jgi:glycosyltransferase involved in cell wall biosynthesis
MKILFVNPHFKIGGIAASLYNLIGELSNNRDLQIDLISLNPYFNEKFKDVRQKVNVNSPFFLSLLFITKKEAQLHLNMLQFAFYVLIKAIAKLIGINTSRKLICQYYYSINKKEGYDAAISFSNDIPLNGANFGSNDFVEFAVASHKKIAYIHNDLDKLGVSREYILRRYRNFDGIVNVSESCKRDFEKRVPEFANKSFLSHNFIDPKIILEKGSELFEIPFDKTQISIITVARLDNTQKRIDRVIDISRRLKEKNHQFSWRILGDGQDFEYLKSLALEAKVDDKLTFMGFVQNPYPYMKSADCFVLASDFEAQGMVLSESLILGTPVITTNFPASKEFVVDGENGFITEKSVEALYQKVEQVITDPILLERISAKAGPESGQANAKKAVEEFYAVIGYK